mgnify:CR=1 FL=1
MFNIGVCYINQEKFNDAIYFFKKSIEESILMNNQNSNTFYYTLFNIGYCYVKLLNYKKAYIFFKNAWAIKSDEDLIFSIKFIENELNLN